MLKRFLKWVLAFNWTLIGILMAFSAILGYIGLKKYYDSISQPHSSLDFIYLTVQLFFFQLFFFEGGFVEGQVPWELGISRFLAPAITAITAFKTCIIIFYDQWQLFKLGFVKDHIIICGLGEKGWQLAQTYRDFGNEVVVIELDEGNDFIQSCRDAGIPVIVGNATEPGILLRAGVLRAKTLITISSDDNSNVNIATNAKDLVNQNGKKPPLNCFLHIINPILCSLLRPYEIMADEEDSFRMDLFNVFEISSRILYKEFIQENLKTSKVSNVLLLGFGPIAQNLIVIIAKEWLRFSESQNQKISFTLVDREIRQKIVTLNSKYRELERFLNFDLIADDPELLAGFSSKLSEKEFSQIFIELSPDTCALTTALSILQFVRNKQVPVVVSMERHVELSKFISNPKLSEKFFQNLRIFGIGDECFSSPIQSSKEQIARAFHEFYVERELVKETVDRHNSRFLPWEKLDEVLKESSRLQVDNLGTFLGKIGCFLSIWTHETFAFSPDEIESLSIKEHERWMRERISQGWTYGETRDDREMKNPNLLPWEKMNDHQKEDQRKIVRVYPQILSRAGFFISRL
ncbi:NAD-binding protein [bacterium]|nr:NAD-binding protein [bacterium]